MKIKISKSQWENIGKVAGWMKISNDMPVLNNKTHKQISDQFKPSRPCNSNDIILVEEGLQCGNCLALTRDHGKTWESPK
jgi:hypothetical protein